MNEICGELNFSIDARIILKLVARIYIYIYSTDSSYTELGHVMHAINTRSGAVSPVSYYEWVVYVDVVHHKKSLQLW